MGSNGLTKNGLVKKVSKMAFGRANDAVRLLFAEQGELEGIEALDLDMVSEIKRHANGAVEVKLLNRIELLGLLAGLVEESGAGEERLRLREFFGALDRAAAGRGGDSDES